jgi:hypothetical protein
MDREDAVGFLEQLGAVVQQRVNLQTHYIIQGSSASSDVDAPMLPIDTSTSEDLSRRQSDGQPIRILTQRQLLAMIPSGLAIARGDLR